MPAYTMSHIICTSALIALVFVMQFSFMYVADNMRTEMSKRELREISDYVSDSLANLYFLANSTDCANVTLEKTLSLPSNVQGFTYSLSIYLMLRPLKPYLSTLLLGAVYGPKLLHGCSLV